MAKKKEPEKQGNEELFLALDLLEKEKGIPAEYMLDKIKKAISTACKNNYGNEDCLLYTSKGKISVEHGFCCGGAYKKHTGKERTSWKK